MKPNMGRTGCLIRCHGEHCSSSQCCSKEKFIEDSSSDLSVKKQGQSVNRKLEKKEIIPASSSIDLKRFITHDQESSSQARQLKDNRSNDGQTRNNSDDIIDDSSCTINVDISEQKSSTIPSQNTAS